MSLGGNPMDEQPHWIDRLYGEAERDRLAKTANAAGGNRSLWRRWRERARLRHLESRERKIIARENLRDFKMVRGDEFGPPGGGY
jgi:hypothetical protein